MRIGIYSGTFDPIHEGHLLLAEVACEQFGLDKVVFIPEQKPRNKQPVASYKNRAEMIELAIESCENPHVVSPTNNLRSHTVNGLMKHLNQTFPDDEYVLVMGGDVFSRVAEWGRKDDEDGSLSDMSNQVSFIVGLKGANEATKLAKLSELHGLNASFIEVPLAKLSSTRVRQALLDGDKQVFGLNDDVAGYISKNNLYI